MVIIFWLENVSKIAHLVQYYNLQLLDVLHVIILVELVLRIQANVPVANLVLEL